MLALGNAMKLPGLRRYLSQSLGFEIERLEVVPQAGRSAGRLRRPPFRRTCCRSASATGWRCRVWTRAGVHTNLLPKEILQDRLISRKKPWAVAAVAALMLGCTISYAYYNMALGAVDPDKWKPAGDRAQQVISQADELKNSFTKAQTDFNATDTIGKNLLGDVEGPRELVGIAQSDQRLFADRSGEQGG